MTTAVPPQDNAPGVPKGRTSFGDDITVFQANAKPAGVFAGLWRAIRLIFERPGLIYQLSKRDLVSIHKKTFGGLLWLVLTPALSISSWVLLRSVGILTESNSESPFVLYILAGTTFWTLFRAAYNNLKKTLLKANKLVLQVRFPHEALIIKEMIVALTTFGFSLVITFVALFAFGLRPRMEWLLFLPTLLPLFLFGAGVGLAVSLMNAIAVDVERLMDLFLGFVMFATPIVYSREDVVSSELSFLVELNPLTYLVTVPRALLLGGESLPWMGYGISSGVAAAMFLLALRAFFAGESGLLERIL